jgi:hypothetical protein
VGQSQGASQTAATLQTLGSSGQEAIALEGQPTPSQPPSLITQVQIGCLTQCFGTTTTGTTTGPLAQRILTELNSLVPPDGSTTLAQAPGTVQNVVDQVICQVQTGEPAPGTEEQTASQTSTVVQLIDLLPSPSTGSATAGPTSVGQADQQIWQLQIGCLFYCADTQQVQQAQQTITAIQVLVEQPGSSAASTTGVVVSAVGGLGAVGSQVVWQLQIGCLAWCYDATQVQDATSQTTVTVITVVPPAETPPAPATPPADPSSPPDQLVAEPPGAVAGTPSTPAAPTPAVAPTSATPFPRSMALAGIAILDRRPSGTGVSPAAASPHTAVPVAAVQSAFARPQTAARFVVIRSAPPTSAHRHQERLTASGESAFHAVPVEAVAGRSGSMSSILFLVLGLVAAGALWAFRGSRSRGGER